MIAIMTLFGWGKRVGRAVDQLRQAQEVVIRKGAVNGAGAYVGLFISLIDFLAEGSTQHPLRSRQS